jgi:aspartyl/glutamyl-tRNA(Asn/Gln) amidotransferase C subunit
MDIEKLFRLSKIKVQEKMLEEVSAKISHTMQMVDSMHQVNCEIDAKGSESQIETTRFRNDEVLMLNTREDLFTNLSTKEREFAERSGYYRVPRVIEN